MAKEFLKLIAATVAVVVSIIGLSLLGAHSGLTERSLFFIAWLPFACATGVAIWCRWQKSGEERERLRELYRQLIDKR